MPRQVILRGGRKASLASDTSRRHLSEIPHDFHTGGPLHGSDSADRERSHGRAELC
jgi:hypothetical protein